MSTLYLYLPGAHFDLYYFPYLSLSPLSIAYTYTYTYTYSYATDTWCHCPCLSHLSCLMSHPPNWRRLSSSALATNVEGEKTEKRCRPFFRLRGSCSSVLGFLGSSFLGSTVLGLDNYHHHYQQQCPLSTSPLSRALPSLASLPVPSCSVFSTQNGHTRIPFFGILLSRRQTRSQWRQ